MADIKLYDFPLSGNCYKVRLLLSMLGLNYESIAVDLAGGESLTEEFKKISPRGQVPVLVDSDDSIWDSMAILSFLARRYGDKTWFPEDDVDNAKVMQWLAVSENEILYGLARARAVFLFKRPFDLTQCQDDGHIGLIAMDQHLSHNKWLATDFPTIADIACYPYVSLAHEGEISLKDYKNVRRWMDDFEALSGWVAIT